MMRILQSKNEELEKAYADLKLSQSRILQQEKMASIGQLAAGVAHEINNPIGFISSNLGTLRRYAERLTGYVEELSNMVRTAPAGADATAKLDQLRKQYKVDHIVSDLQSLIDESLEGIERVKTIVANLKSFSRVDQAVVQAVDIHECLDSTINIVWNEIKYKAELRREYGELPPLRCYPQQLNQVFMNLLVNAAQAISEQGVIIVRTLVENQSLLVVISDSGQGIPEEDLAHLFEPFFTTKEIGKGTGLGLSIAYDIITKQHKGEITVQSSPGHGSTFTIRLPLG
jgi:two-component system NtrC family sensor kinase